MKTQNRTSLITDEQSLVSARFKHGTPIQTYDDGFGALYVHRNSMGVCGIVRAQTWEEAYEICEDEFFSEAEETIEEIHKEYNFVREHVKIVRSKPVGPEGVAGVERDCRMEDYPLDKNGLEFVRWETRETPCEDESGFADNALFQEAFGFRPNGARAGKWEDGTPRDPIGHGIYAKDLNGDSLDLLTLDRLADWGIVLVIENENGERSEISSVPAT